MCVICELTQKLVKWWGSSNEVWQTCLWENSMIRFWSVFWDWIWFLRGWVIINCLSFCFVFVFFFNFVCKLFFLNNNFVMKRWKNPFLFSVGVNCISWCHNNVNVTRLQMDNFPNFRKAFVYWISFLKIKLYIWSYQTCVTIWNI